jgi:hypothetical protein
MTPPPIPEGLDNLCKIQITCQRSEPCDNANPKEA